MLQFCEEAHVLAELGADWLNSLFWCGFVYFNFCVMVSAINIYSEMFCDCAICCGPCLECASDDKRKTGFLQGTLVEPSF